MDPYTASLCALVLIVAAVMEFIAHSRARMVAFLAAFGFLMLGVRYAFLVYTGDLGRLNLIGTGSIGAIALSRIMACAEELGA